MADLTEKEIERFYPFKGRVFEIASCKAVLPDGSVADRDVMCHSGGVCVLPLDQDGNVTVVRQYRYGAGCETLEIPAGKLEKGESPDEAIRRELEEETGYHADEIRYLGFIYSSPAISTEKIYIYLATGLHAGKPHFDSDEFLSIEKYPLDSLVQMVMDGSITDAKTQIAILKADRLSRELR
ncbi:MAG: NUDIX hydrolase [Eubacteriales bacterium]